MSDEKHVLFNSAKDLLKIGKDIQPINSDIASFIFFLSDRVLSIADRKGYTELGEKVQDNQCQCRDRNREEIRVVGGQKPIHSCNGHSNTPTPKPVSEDVQVEVRNLVEKIRLEHRDAGCK